MEIIPQKQCTRCKQEYPATTAYFHKESRNQSGLNPVCKQCSKTAYAANPQKKVEAVREYRAKNKEAIAQRAKTRRALDGGANAQKCAIYRRNNKEVLDKKSREYYATHRDLMRARRKEYVARHKDAVLQGLRDYYKKNRKQLLEYAQEYRKKNRLILRERNKRYRHLSKIARRKRRALLKNLPNDFSEKDWQDCLQYFNHRCAVCGKPNGLWHTLAPDHWIPISSSECPGTVKSNIIPLCHSKKDGAGGCNNAKLNKPAEQWLVERYGKRKAKTILDRIHAYFEWAEQQ